MVTRSHLLDLNVLIALTWPQHVHHGRAHSWFDTQFGSEVFGSAAFEGAASGSWATTPITESGFLRLSTNRAVVGETVPMAQALAVLGAIRALPGHSFIPDGSSLSAPTISLGRMASSRQVTDAHLVNLAVASGSILTTLDRGIVELLDPADRGHVLLLPQLD